MSKNKIIIKGLELHEPLVAAAKYQITWTCSKCGTTYSFITTDTNIALDCPRCAAGLPTESPNAPTRK